MIHRKNPSRPGHSFLARGLILVILTSGLLTAPRSPADEMDELADQIRNLHRVVSDFRSRISAPPEPGATELSDWEHLLAERERLTLALREQTDRQTALEKTLENLHAELALAREQQHIETRHLRDQIHTLETQARKDQSTLRELEQQLAKTRTSHRETLASRHANLLRETITDPNDPSLAWSLNDVGLILSAQGRLDEAEALFLQAGNHILQTLGADHPALGTLLQNRAENAWRKPDLDSAAELYAQAAHHLQTSLGKQHLRRAVVLNDWASVLRQANRTSEAEPLFREALAIYDKQRRPPPLDTAATLNHLGLILLEQGNPDAASPLLQRALTLLPPRQQSFAQARFIVLQSLISLATITGDIGLAQDLDLQARRLVAEWMLQP
ncbi:MAG TPA: tetratricopeptide repeat protein [Kiritimatiellia bacterium]|nr:tetratricopeptide repeat protein [Kiritimatiellia bacterium]